MNNEVYYRPEWTCGKYNAAKHVAIMFNLLSNGEYFFERESADVVGMILNAGRNGEVSVALVSEKLQITPESITPFFNSLTEIGLLSDKLPTKSDIDAYRKYCIALPTKTTYIGEEVEHYLQCDISTVEQAYGEAVRDCTEITSVVFELTYRCSEKCLHCYNVGATRNDSEVSGRGSLVELTIDDYKRIIDDMCDAGLVTVTLTGGDPFAYNDIWKILEYLYQKDLAVTILTNGQQLLNQIDRLAGFYPKSVRLSLYSAVPETHDKLTRKRGAWENTLAVIRALRNNAVPVAISCVLMKPGLKSYLQLKTIAENLSCPILFDLDIVDSIEGDVCATQHLRLTPDELELVMMDPDIEPLTKDGEFYSKPIPSKGIPCFAGMGTFCVMPNGKLIPCVSMHMELGDLRKQNFHSIITDNPKLNNLLGTPKSEYVECGTHDYCKCCSFCAGNSYAKYRTPFRANENNCYMAKNRYSLQQKWKSGIDVLKRKTLQENIDALPEYSFSEMHREYKQRAYEGPKILYNA